MKSPRNFFFFHLWKSFHFVAHRMMLTPGFSGWKIQKETENYVSYLKEFKRANLGYFILANNSWSILYSRLQIDLWTKWTIIENWIRKVKKGDFPGGTVIRNSPSNAGDMGSIPGQGTKIPHATWCSQRQNKQTNKNPERTNGVVLGLIKTQWTRITQLKN